MESNGTPTTFDFSRPVRRLQHTDYKEKLARTKPSPTVPETPFARALAAFRSDIETVAGEAATDTVAFQCVAVAVLQALARVRCREQRSAEAAISLAQQQRLGHMVETIGVAEQAVRRVLSEPGRQMMAHSVPAAALPAEPSWWFALCETIQALEEALAWIASVARQQPEESPVRMLGRSVGRLLTRHYDLLVAEAEDWLD